MNDTERDSLIESLVAAVRATERDAAGRSGGSVYMIHRKQFLALRAALAAWDDARGTPINVRYGEQS